MSPTSRECCASTAAAAAGESASVACAPSSIPRLRSMFAAHETLSGGSPSHHVSSVSESRYRDESPTKSIECSRRLARAKAFWPSVSLCKPSGPSTKRKKRTSPMNCVALPLAAAARQAWHAARGRLGAGNGLLVQSLLEVRGRLPQRELRRRDLPAHVSPSELRALAALEEAAVPTLAGAIVVVEGREESRRWVLQPRDQGCARRWRASMRWGAAISTTRRPEVPRTPADGHQRPLRVPIHEVLEGAVVAYLAKRDCAACGLHLLDCERPAPVCI